MNKSKRNKIFVGYSHRDREAEEAIERINLHLKPLVRDGLDLWVDTKIKAGQRWKDAIKTALDEAKVAILLVSADFLASDFIRNNELPPVLMAATEEGLVVLPVILSESILSRSKLGKFQSVNSPNKPISALNYSEREKFWNELAQTIEELFNLESERASEGPDALEISIEVPDDLPPENLKEFIRQIVSSADAIHRSRGGDGLKIDLVECFEDARIPEGANR